MADEIQNKTTNATGVDPTSVLRGADAFKQYAQILVDVGLQDPQEVRLAFAVLRLVKGASSPEEFIGRVVEEYHCSEDIAHKIAQNVADQMLTPFKDQLPFSLENAVRIWSGLALIKPTPQEYVHRYVSALPGIDEPHAIARLQETFLQYLGGFTTRDQTKERLMRSEKLDGMGLEDALADIALDNFDEDREEKGFGKQALEMEKTAELPVELPVKQPELVDVEPQQDVVKAETTETSVGAQEVPVREVEPVSVVIPLPEREKEMPEQIEPLVEVVSPVMPVGEMPVEPEIMTPELPVVSEPVVPDALPAVSDQSSMLTAGDDSFNEADQEELEKITKEKAHVLESTQPIDVLGVVKMICQNPVFQFEDALLQDRCQKLVESRVRDVRDAVGVRELLERSVEKGGLGVTGRRLADILQALEQYVNTFHRQASDRHTSDRERVQDAKHNAERDHQDQVKKEEQQLSKKYVQLTGKIPTETIQPVSPLSRTSAAVSAHHEMLAREGKIDTNRVREALEQAQRVSSQKPASQGSPSMQEVSFTKRLSGPIDELARLSLTDFRRLSADPMSAVAKVKGKVDLMEASGYDKKVEAISAWRLSPINQMYVDLSRNAILQGTSVADLLEKKRAQGEETLTDAELQAVMQLNADLRF